MLILNEENYTESIIKSRMEIKFFKNPCTTLVFGYSNNEVITWQMNYYRPSTFWTERTIFGAYGPMNQINRKKVRNNILLFHLEINKYREKHFLINSLFNFN